MFDLCSRKLQTYISAKARYDLRLFCCPLAFSSPADWPSCFLSGFANMEEGGEIRISDIAGKLRLWAE